MQCHEVASFLARRADDAETLGASVRAEVDQHVAACAACRAELDAQRAVAVLLRARPADRLSPQFAARLSSRLDDAAGWFGIADWRVWTLRLAPVAAALALATYLGLGDGRRRRPDDPLTIGRCRRRMRQRSPCCGRTSALTRSWRRC